VHLQKQVNRYNRLTGKSISGARDIALAAANDEIAVAVFNDFGSKLVSFLEPWFKKFGVEILVIGGNISLSSDSFCPSLRNALVKEELSVQVEISELKVKASIIGSARLIEPDYWGKVKTILKEM